MAKRRVRLDLEKRNSMARENEIENRQPRLENRFHSFLFVSIRFHSFPFGVFHERRRIPDDRSESSAATFSRKGIGNSGEPGEI